MQTGISTNTVKRMLFDAGAVYRDYGEGGQELIGATRGGATLTVERDDREIEVDGTRGPVQGLRRTARHTVMLEFTLLEISRQTLLDILKGTSTSNGTHHTITPSNDIVDADFYTNVALVADISGTSTPAIIKILAAMFDGGFTLTTEDKNEGELAVTVQGHYTVADLDTPPYQILLPVAAS